MEPLDRARLRILLAGARRDEEVPLQGPRGSRCAVAEGISIWVVLQICVPL